MKRITIILALIALLLPFTTFAQGIMYSIPWDHDQLYEIDPATGTSLSSITITSAEGPWERANGLTAHPVTGELWGLIQIAWGSPRLLVTIDPATGVVTTIGATTESFSGLAFHTNGTLYGITGEDIWNQSHPASLFEISTIDASSTFIFDFQTQNFDGEAIAFNPDDGLMYHHSTNIFQSLDLNTLALTNIPLVGHPSWYVKQLVYIGSGEFRLGERESPMGFYSLTTTGVQVFRGYMNHETGGLAYSLPTNQPPVAQCQDVTVSAGGNCSAAASIDNGSYDPDGDSITLTQSPPGPYPLGSTLVMLTVDDGLATAQCQATVTVTGGTGTISGNVAVSGSGLAGVIVKLLDENEIPVVGIDDDSTDVQGNYTFSDVSAGSDPTDYKVMIVEPLGYAVDANPKLTSLFCGDDNTVNFALTEIVLSNQARNKGYWKHQFDVYVHNKGYAHESEADLQNYIELVHSRYTTYFTIFDGLTLFEDWQAVLSVKGNAGMEAKAKVQLAALVLNIMSLKNAQYEVVTTDGHTAGDVLTYVSELIEDGDPSNDALARDLAEYVNTQQTISSGQVFPSQNILYKNGVGQSPNDGGLVVPKEYALLQNYPNPFNPATTIRFALPEAGSVSVKIYNAQGKLVRTLANGYYEAGYHNIRWDATNHTGEKVASGLYFYRLQSKDFQQVKKMLLLK